MPKLPTLFKLIRDRDPRIPELLRANKYVRAMRAGGPTYHNMSTIFRNNPELIGLAESGWLGNPAKWAGNSGASNVTRSSAVSSFEDILDAILSTQSPTGDKFRQAFRELEGKTLGYYQPENYAGSHVESIHDRLAALLKGWDPSTTPYSHFTRSTPLPINDATSKYGNMIPPFGRM